MSCAAQASRAGFKVAKLAKMTRADLVVMAHVVTLKVEGVSQEIPFGRFEDIQS